ncbi:organic cation transporter protein [Elysia marginata]|uniref:Organic cation transporter protein n=1 Tax=Elysia marginata TaxID=1093978 RepID=A0AAV4F5H9_9GAST|nr:organic cation transporter protein [Elysia marginata]
MDESIIWLLANGKKEEAIKCIKKAARWNNKDYEEVLKCGYADDTIEMEVEVDKTPRSDGLDGDESAANRPMLGEVKATDTCKLQDLDENDSRTNSESDTITEHEKISFIQVLRIRRLLINSVAMWVTWFSASLGYFTLYLMVSTLAGDKYINYILTSLMDIPACSIFFFGFNKYGRRSVTILLYSVLAVGTFTLGLLRHFTDSENETWAVITLITSLISIVGGSGCFFSIFFYLPELFPTNVRNQATGYASCFARIGAMISPFMAALANIAIWAPGLVMGVFASIAVFLLFLLPETKNRQLPQTIAEMESWYKKDNSSSGKDSNGKARSV